MIPAGKEGKMDPEKKNKAEKMTSEKKKEIGNKIENKIENKIDKAMEKPYVRVGKKTLELFLKNDMIVYAGHATLGVLTAIFPLIMLIISLLNMMPGYDPEIFTDFVFRFMPDIPQFRSLFFRYFAFKTLQIKIPAIFIYYI